ncbi:A disintegrin and metalloproteinase with thrombospondin motifs 7-like [Anthonomus grandis grandis]|uniref:A disintegrin and metalloproteinase with thrombospondin motifs 7-like n=1 Tax=Anthonomus grandis grandis TaxID=2921223 RepID=UPI0021654B3B|nr:A disintegrin and metalloproteinase with thrombospondin motifs 7-like [Anthonomus grandis grandis]XP_050293148.1 A disintegrin and metalloproteinase with thrombospondin motifs 7-like [Anthonomus grandis grandis]XP_050293149.1 A disintegrin and metalloproteinase with thrombospondin motifs 7-like [Anthonomus grandis grandis]XP_050293150.1 A disintegrin and metalloproteinase with thrombospondin motifs 7-like [Anthonomus grandis grandis]XP_050293151.1 A disintegrin and metalloproteinase with thr
MGPLTMGPIIGHLWWLVIITLGSAEILEKPRFRGLYTNELTEAHEAIPIKVDHNGNHLSDSLIHHYITKNDTLRINVTIYAQDHHLVLTPSKDFLAPQVIIERRLKDRHVRTRPKHISANCHYQGYVHGDGNSRVALSTCNGLAGTIQTSYGKFFVEPSYHPDQIITPGHKHLIYKRSAVINSLPENITLKKKRKKKRKKYNHNQSNCGTREPKRWTQIEWQKQMGKVRVQERKHKHNKIQNKVKLNNVDQSQWKKLKYKHVNSAQRSKRSVSQPHFVETAIVADGSMVEFHQDGDIETYILTLMNMVSSFYQDPTIGNYINIAVVKIILLDDSSENPEFNSTTNADVTLKNFCKWQREQNPKDDSHPHHHDVAILLTRKDICARQDTPCGTLGVAHIGGMCKASRSCSVNEDNGITSAHTIAHEMGHNFGMLHDTEKIGCKRKEGNKVHIMTPALDADAVQVTWSNCSRREVTNFLDKGMGKCLQDRPSESYEYPELPAGAMYNAEYQCRFQFGTPDATVCTPLDEICFRLWCTVNDSCTTLLRPAAPGTNCGKHKWCQDQKCVPIMDPPVPIDGGWGEWSSWSECSRTCGSGVSIMSRECDHPTPTAGGKFCVGERKRYRICNTDPCPEGEPTYRALQCSSNNNKTYEGKKYEWQPYFDQAEPCQLYCSDVNETLIVPWGDYAADGTPCNVVSRDVCISGICKKVGCDWVVDSAAKEDECGICQGDGTKCDIIQGEYKKQSSLPGYREIVVIPGGARNIFVAENDQSENYIGLENALEKKYYLNGKRHITLPGEYNVGGAQALYERDHLLEKIRIPGPIYEPILVSIYFVGKTYNPGVVWKYSIWKPEVTKQVKYTWIMDEWSQCSATCGGGTQYKKALCQESTVSPVASELESPTIVAEEMCDDVTKPDKQVRNCNDDPCPYKWWVGPWQACPVTCYDGGKRPMRKRNLMCIDGKEVALPDHYCDRGAKPHEYEPCKHLLPCEAYER